MKKWKTGVRIAAFALVVALAIIVPGRALAANEILTFGVYPYDSPTQVYSSFEPLAEAIAKAIGRKVEIVIAPNYMAHIANISEGRVDLGFMGPSPYIKAHDRFGGVELLARLVTQGERNDRLVVIAHQDSGIGSLAELKAKTFVFGDHQSYGSHFYPRYILNRAGVKLKDLKSYDYLGNHSRVVLAVAHRDFDAGGVREDIYERYRDRAIKKIAGPFNMPPHVIVCRRGLPRELKEQIRKMLLSPMAPEVLKAIDPLLSGFGPVADRDFAEARRVVDFVEDK
ncbi:MAG: phosphate/phosphite/phosphonate ABC transporter substrate-binding protein [Desulfurivibrionaceae bacterium]